MESEPSVEVLLARWRGGDDDARDALITRLYPELSQIAAARLRGERNSSLSTGDLINDAVIRLINLNCMSIVDRAHFMALASRLMRQILVDHARLKSADKRKHQKVELTTRVENGQSFDLYALNSALIRLAAINPKLAVLVEMRYFGGMTLADVATVTEQSEATVKRSWQVARAWLTDALANRIDAP